MKALGTMQMEFYVKIYAVVSSNAVITLKLYFEGSYFFINFRN